MDRAPGPKQTHFMDPERGRGNEKHEENPDPTKTTMRQGALWRSELNDAETERCDRRNSADLNGDARLKEWIERRHLRSGIYSKFKTG